MPAEPPPRHPDGVDPDAANEVLYNSVAREYLKRAEIRLTGNDTWLLPFLTAIGAGPGARALDVGSAVGTNARYLAKHGYDVTGVDYAPNMVTTARAACAGLDNRPRFVLKDFRDWTRTGDRFDLVVATAFIHLFRPPEDEWITERILSHVAPGGTAILSTTVEPAHSQQLRPKWADSADDSVPPGLERWRNHYTGRSFLNLVRRAAATTFGAACTVDHHVTEDPDPALPGHLWSDVSVTRTA